VEKEYESLSKEAIKLIWRNQKKYMVSIASKSQFAVDLGNIKGVFDSIKRLTNASQVSIIPVKTKDGKCTTTSEGQLQGLDGVLQRNPQLWLHSLEERGRGSDMSSPSTTDECKNIIEEGSYLCNRVNKNGKATGWHNIPAEILKLSS
jgi:hypothetical protein